MKKMLEITRRGKGTPAKPGTESFPRLWPEPLARLYWQQKGVQDEAAEAGESEELLRKFRLARAVQQQLNPSLLSYVEPIVGDLSKGVALVAIRLPGAAAIAARFIACPDSTNWEQSAFPHKPTAVWGVLNHDGLLCSFCEHLAEALVTAVDVHDGNIK